MGQAASSAGSRGFSDSARVSRAPKHTKNRGKRFFKWPRNQKGVPRSWPLLFYLQQELWDYPEKHGFLDAVLDPLEANLSGYCKTWDTSGALELHNIAELSAGVEMPRIGARLHSRISFVSVDWLKLSLKEHIIVVSVGLLTTMNHSLAYNLILRNLTDPACMSSNSIQEHLGHRLLSSIKYVYKDDQRDSSIRPTCGHAFFSSFEIGNLAPGSKDSWYLRQEVDLRVAFPLGVLNGALNAGMSARLIHPMEREHTGSVVPLSERFYLDANRSLVCSLGGPSSLSGFKSKGHVAVTAFADLSFDLPLKPLRELGIHGHTFISAGNLAKLTEHGRGKLSLTDLLQTFKSCAGFGVVLPTRLFRIEMNYCYTLKQFDHDKGKAGLQFNFSLR